MGAYSPGSLTYSVEWTKIKIQICKCLCQHLRWLHLGYEDLLYCQELQFLVKLPVELVDLNMKLLSLYICKVHASILLWGSAAWMFPIQLCFIHILWDSFLWGCMFPLKLCMSHTVTYWCSAVCIFHFQLPVFHTVTKLILCLVLWKNWLWMTTLSISGSTKSGPPGHQMKQDRGSSHNSQVQKYKV